MTNIIVQISVAESRYSKHLQPKAKLKQNMNKYVHFTMFLTVRRALPWPPNKLFIKLANLATPEYEIHCFQIPSYTFQDSNIRGDFLATCKLRSCFQRPRPNRSDDKIIFTRQLCNEA